MNTYLYEANGRVVQVFANGQGAPVGVAGLLLCDSEKYMLPGACYVRNGTVLPMPEKPSPEYTFNYDSGQWEDQRTNETEWRVVRVERDALLSQSDWTQLPDVPLVTKEAWAVYRQALRDVTLQPDPFNIVWPVAPVQS